MLSVKDPIITSQPPSRTNHAGTTVAFNVGVNGTLPAYQWFKDGAPASGATNPTLLLPAVSTRDGADYSVQVSNAYGSLFSSPARLTVASPLLIEHITVTGGAAAVIWSAIPGANYALQYKEHPDDTNWNDLPPPVTASGTNAAASDVFGGSPQRFYRVFLLP